MELAPTWQKRLEKTQESLLEKVKNMKTKDLFLKGHVHIKGDLLCHMTYHTTYDRNGNLRSIKAEIGYGGKRKFASSGKAQNGQTFKIFPGEWDKTLEAIKGTTPAAIEIIEEMKKIIQARREQGK